MKFKKMVSKLLACAMVVTTVFTGNVTTANAEGEAKVLEPVAKYDFEAGVSDDDGKYQDIQMITRDLEDYTGTLDFKAGRNGEGKAISTDGAEATGGEGKYGMKLPQTNLGDEYTVSVWFFSSWPTLNSKNDTPPKTFAVMSIGKDAEESVTVKPPAGTNGRVLYLYSGSTQASGNMDNNGDNNYWKNWHMFTISQSGNQVTCYLDGVKKLETTAEPLLNDAGGSIYFGVNQGGGGYATGQYDDIYVYDVALNDAQVSDLYTKGSVEDNRTPDQIFESRGITVSPENGTLATGNTLQLQAVIPEGVPEESVTVSYASSDSDIATVSNTGLVTAVAKGTATITATAVMGDITKIATAAIEVKGTPEDILKEVDTIDVTETITLNPGDKATVKVTLPAGLNAGDCAISFAVKDSSDAVTVNAATGEITAVKAGTAEITTSVTVGATTKTGTTSVKVRGVSDILQEEDIRVTENIRITGTGTGQIEVALPTGVTSEDVNITYALKAGAASDVATVNNAGLVTGVKAGRTVITTTVTSKTDTAVSKSADTNVRVISTQVSQELVVEYDLSGAEDGKLVDISNHGNDATIQGKNVSFETVNGEDIMTLGANTYLDLPTSIMDDLETDKEVFTIETRFAKSAACGANAWLFCLGSNVGSQANYLFLSPNFSGTLRSGIKNSSTEILFTTDKQPGNDIFHTVDMVFDHGVIKLYMDGVLVKGASGDSIDSKYSIMDDVVGTNTSETILGYIGKSLYASDGLYQGKISSFKIYNRALTDEEVQTDELQQAFQQEVTEKLELTAADLGTKNPSVDEVAYDLSLPGEFNECAVTWQSANTDIIANDGKVYNDESANKKVKLTATVTSGAMTATKDIEITVLKADKEALNKKIGEANDKIAASQDYKPESIESLRQVLQQAQEAKGQTRIDTAVSDLTRAINALVEAKGDRDPFAKITASCYDKNVTLEPTKTATVFRLPSTLKLNEDVTITYASSNENIAKVSASGVVTAQKKVGYARITTTVKAVYDGFEMEYQTLVKVNHDITKVKVAANVTSLAKGKTATITVTPTAAMKNAGYTVNCTASGAVSVKNNKVVTGQKSGTGTVAVKISSAGKTITKRITFNVGEITGKSSVKVKKSITLKVSGLSGKVTWSLDKKGKKLATISKSGKLTAKKKAGTAKVTAKVKVGSKTISLTKSVKIKK